MPSLSSSIGMVMLSNEFAMGKSSKSFDEASKQKFSYNPEEIQSKMLKLLDANQRRKKKSRLRNESGGTAFEVNLNVDKPDLHDMNKNIEKYRY